MITRTNLPVDWYTLPGCTLNPYSLRYFSIHPDVGAVIAAKPLTMNRLIVNGVTVELNQLTDAAISLPAVTSPVFLRRKL